MIVSLVDGTYELFRHFFGAPPRAGDDGAEIAAAHGVTMSIVRMLAEGSVYLAVATDHVIESFRNELWPSYKDGSAIDPLLRAQFDVLEEALESLGVVVWPMVELEADDALATAAAQLAADKAVTRVLICTPDKDLAQCVVDKRIVQLDRRSGNVRDEAGVWERFGVGPKSIVDWLALVGDSADGFPGLSGWGARSASTVLAHYQSFDNVPDDITEWDGELRKGVRGSAKLAETLARQREQAQLFRVLATLRLDADISADTDTLLWRGPRDSFEDMCRYFRDPSLFERVAALASR